MSKPLSTSTTEELIAIGRRLRMLRQTSGLHQAEWCRDVGITPQSWNNYENGYARIGLDAAFRLVRKHGVSLDWIYFGEEAMLPKRVADGLQHLVELERLRKDPGDKAVPAKN